MTLRLKSLIALTGMALAVGAGVVLPAGPASAGPICPILVEPTEDCPGAPEMPWMRPVPPPNPTPPPAPEPMPAPPTPGLPPDALCLTTPFFSSPIFASDRQAPVYIFRVRAEYCVDVSTGLLVFVRGTAENPVPGDARVRITAQPSPKDVTFVTPSSPATRANVIFQIDVSFNPGVLKGYHHEHGLVIRTRPLAVDPISPPVFYQTF